MVKTRKIQTAVDVEVYWRRVAVSSVAAEANSELAFVDMGFLPPQRAYFPWEDGTHEKSVVLALGGEPRGKGYLKGVNQGCGGRLQRQT
jgi:hypothetical protein